MMTLPLAAMRRSQTIRVIWAACLLVATINHARIIVQNGIFWNYGGAPWPSTAYWSSLTVLDPAAAALLFIRPRLGMVITAALISTNVVHNLAFTAWHAPAGELLYQVASSTFMISQIGFMVFVALTFRIAWKGAES